MIKRHVLLLTVAVFTLPMVVTLGLKHAGEDGIEAEDHLQSMMTELQVQDGIEWRAVGDRSTPRSAHQDLVAARGRAKEHLEESEALGLSSAGADRITRITSLYSQKADEEVRLLSLGKKKASLDFDNTQVDPAFRQVQTVLRSESDQLHSQAERAQRLGDAGVLLTVLLSLLLVSVVQGRRRRAGVRSQAKEQSEARYRTLIDQSSDLVLVVDRDGRADFLSPSAERLLASRDQDPGTTSNAILTTPFDFVDAVEIQDRRLLLTALQSAAPGRTPAAELRISGRHGTSTYEVTVQDLTGDPSVSGLLLTGHDITDRLALHLEMEHRALHDELTGLPNRALLADRFEQVLLGAERDGTSVGLLLLDLDRFKEVNDTFGHHYGDELLRQIGPRLTGVLRSVDTIARLGGDEFAVLLADVHGVDAATRVATALLGALAVPFRVEGIDLDVEASIGLVISGEHGEDAATLMQHADIAMYIAKGQHLGVFAYDPAIDGHSATKLALVGALRRAMERDQLVLYYQPKLSVTTGELVGAEALVRWRHPEQGLLLPGEFIPLAERTGLINPLTRHIMEAALTQARAWLDAGRPLPIAVNLSARNLHDEHFAEVVAKVLAEYDVPPRLLELEVTESAIMLDPVRARQTLEELAALGVRISIDDFGAGYTSLSQLTSIPISEIKIDRSFILKMADDPGNAQIVSSVVELGHNLGLTLVAEGVETEDNLQELARLGCDVAQGFHLSRPMPAADFDTWSIGRPITPLPPQD